MSRYRRLPLALLAALLALAGCRAPTSAPAPTRPPDAPQSASPTQTSAQPATPGQAEAEPRVFLLDPHALLATRRQLQSGDPDLKPALDKLLRDADGALKLTPPSVVEKSDAPPSGDRHDFLSYSRYWWPNPDTPSGLPYVRRDGQVNPDIRSVPDDENLTKMESAVDTLALAYFFTGDERYAAQAARLLRTWFLDDATRMNPNMTYSQLVRGVDDERGAGILDGREFSRLIDSIGLLAGSAAWTEQDQQGMRDWLGAYLDWLRTSDSGEKESQRENNHGSWYDVQVVAIALFLGNDDLATTQLKRVRSQRIAKQITSDGRQPLELERTRSWDYSIFNLEALFRLAALGERAGVKLWRYKDDDGAGLRTALDYLMPFALGERKWRDKQISGWDPAALAPLLRQAAAAYDDRDYLDASRAVAGEHADELRENLLYPAGKQ